MSAGSDMRLYVKDNEGEFILLAGLRTKALKLRAQTVEATHLESPLGWRELLPGAGVKFADISGSGIFTSAASSALARVIFFAQELRDYQIVLPELGLIEGEFVLSELTYTGTYEGEAVFELLLQSAGPPSFAPHIPG